MPLQQSDSVIFYSFELFSAQPLIQAVFSRHGGVSSGSFAELNVGLTVGDDPAKVARNRQISFDLVNRPIQSLSDSWLVHGTEVLIYDQPRPRDQPIPAKADVILTNNPQVTLFMRYADCVPILLYDPVQRVIGLAHAGWRGTVQGAGRSAVEAMQTRYSTDPADLLAGIGPSIGPDQYEVGPEVEAQVRAAFSSGAERLLPRYNRSVHFDLWAANRLVLEDAGVKSKHIELASICTASHNEDWFSHRGDGGKTGRFGALLALEE
jgi:YfiH family protein